MKRTPLGVGDRVGMIVLTGKEGKSNDGHIVWRCICDCGNECFKSSTSMRGSQREGRIASCGCLTSSVISAKRTTHGMKYTATYESWHSAKSRCSNKNDKSFEHYGGRGIHMAQRWALDFSEFHRDMGDKPDGLTLERIDVNGNYEPGNCKWATKKDQARNRRRSIYVQWRGAEVHLSVAAEDLGITYGAAFMRLKRGKLHESISV